MVTLSDRSAPSGQHAQLYRVNICNRYTDNKAWCIVDMEDILFWKIIVVSREESSLVYHSLDFQKRHDRQISKTVTNMYMFLQHDIQDIQDSRFVGRK